MTPSRSGRLIAVIAAVLLACAPGAVAQGVPPRLEAAVDVNVVFVGFEQKTYFGRGDEPHARPDSRAPAGASDDDGRSADRQQPERFAATLDNSAYVNH